MLTQTRAHIYLSEKRGATISEGVRSLHTLPFGDQNETFGRLMAFNDETLEAGKQIAIRTNKPTEIVLVPIVGGLELMDSHGESIFVSAGETFNFFAFPESSFNVINPYSEETINFIQIRIKPEFSDHFTQSDASENPLTSFSLTGKNTLVNAFSAAYQNVFGFLGLFDGRQEDIFSTKNAESDVFVYIIQGAFEVQNRLLERGDALSLTSIEEVEFEALSNGAIILVMEVT